jgi:monofunctional biosynthetic peptidoglycan transglycosylase
MIKKAFLGLVLLVLVALVSLFFLERAALSKLDALGVEFSHMDRGILTREFHQVRFRGMTAERVTSSLFSPKTVQITGLHVPIDPDAGSEHLGADGPTRLPADIEASLSQVSLSWGETPLVEGLSGRLSKGRLVLDGPGLHVSSGKDDLRVDWDGALPFEALSAEASLHLELSGRLIIEVVLSEITINHPLLRARPIALNEGLIKLEGDRLAKRLHGSLTVDGVQWELNVNRDGGSLDLDLVLPPTPILEVLRPLKAALPELKKAEVSGSVSAQAQIQWPAKTWDADFHLENLEVQGAVPQIQALREGLLQHRIIDHEGDAIIRETGEGSAEWTALRNIAAPMRHAIIAAEDIRFSDHPGYDMEAIRDALQANKEAGKVIRGGSSLSQQLAKNLYLDGQRTLIRKIRELLLAVELDETLGKGRILELYLNVVEWGPGIHGISAASERYFMRRPSQLDPNEAAFLAAILPSPQRFYKEQYLSNKASETRIDWILKNMGDAGHLSAAEVQYWTQAPLRFVPPPVD